MKKYVKKPIPVEALQWTGNNPREILDFCKDAAVIREDEMAFRLGEGQYHLYIKTLEGKMYAKYGDYIIKGVNGEFYPCKCDIFKNTYEEVQESCEVEGKPPMTLEEAIAHCEDVVKKSTTKCACSKEHEQLRNWLIELKDIREKYKYAVADIQNLKKRFEREKMDYIHQANREIIEDFVNVHDNIILALKSCESDDKMYEGINLVRKEIEKILDAEGAEMIPCEVGEQFDPNVHQAVFSEEKDDMDSGLVTKVWNIGWTLNGRLLRPVNVSVSR